MEREGDAHLDDPLPGGRTGAVPAQAPRQGPSAVGVAGILRREEQLAAATDRCWPCRALTHHVGSRPCVCVCVCVRTRSCVCVCPWARVSELLIPKH